MDTFGGVSSLGYKIEFIFFLPINTKGPNEYRNSTLNFINTILENFKKIPNLAVVRCTKHENLKEYQEFWILTKGEIRQRKTIIKVFQNGLISFGIYEIQADIPFYSKENLKIGKDWDTEFKEIVDILRR